MASRPLANCSCFFVDLIRQKGGENLVDNVTNAVG
jgi:hypothetical protein